MDSIENACEKDKRIVYLDIARTLAIILVIFCHAVETIYKMNIFEWNSINIWSKIFKTAAFTVGRLGVPIFLFISGQLLLRKNIETGEDCLKFYKKICYPC